MKKSLLHIIISSLPHKLISFLFLLLFVNYSLLTVNCYSQWTQLPNLPVTGTVYDMYFVNANTGWVTFNTSGTILKTMNGGLNWAQQITPASEVYNIQFFNDTIGVALSYLSTNRLILSTTNGGSNWNQIYSTSYAWSNMQFVNKDTGWVCGFDGTFGGVWRTIDGGNSWIRQYTSASNGLNLVFFLKQKYNNEYYGWTFLDESIFRTTNSGVNWSVVFNNMPAGGVYSVYFSDTSTGVITRSSDIINKTSNGGYSWSTINITHAAFGRIGMANNNIGWLTIGEDSIIKTTNFFQTFGKQVIPPYANIIFAVDTSVVYAKANLTNMIKTTNGGGNIAGIEVISHEIPKQFYLYQNYPNPFNPTTRIEFQLIKSSRIKLVIYDVLGREVKELINEKLSAGLYKVLFNAETLPSGIYFYKLITDSETSTKKMSLIK